MKMSSFDKILLGLSKERELEDFVEIGAGLNYYYIKANRKKLLHLLLQHISQDQLLIEIKPLDTIF